MVAALGAWLATAKGKGGAVKTKNEAEQALEDFLLAGGTPHEAVCFAPPSPYPPVFSQPLGKDA